MLCTLRERDRLQRLDLVGRRADVLPENVVRWQHAFRWTHLGGRARTRACTTCTAATCTSMFVERRCIGNRRLRVRQALVRPELRNDEF